MDLLLGADNAIVIGMACRDLDPKIRTKGIVLGTVGAVIVRALATVAVVWLLNIKFIMLVGGILLVFIGYKLVAKKDEEKNVQAKDSLLKAVLTVMAADILMGIDNVLAVAGAAQGSYILVIFGLCLSIPIMVIGSTLIIKLMERFPVIIYVGAGVIFYTGADMIAGDPSTEAFFVSHRAIDYVLKIAVVAGGLLISYLMKKRIDKSP
jgi:YjbE family integral membrane protein